MVIHKFCLCVAMVLKYLFQGSHHSNLQTLPPLLVRQDQRLHLYNHARFQDAAALLSVADRMGRDSQQNRLCKVQQELYACVAAYQAGI